MSSYYQLTVGWTSAPVYLRLAKALGIELDAAIGRYVRMIDHVLREAPDGSTADLDPRDLAALMGWDGDPGVLVETLKSVGVVTASGALADSDRMTKGYKAAEAARQRREVKKLNGGGATSATVGDASRRSATRRGSSIERTNERTNEHRDSSEPVSDRSKPAAPELLNLTSDEVEKPILTFPAVGKGASTWNLTETIRQELAEAFPGVDVVGEAKKARAWIVANPTKRKTAKGYRAFLTRWIAKANDSGRTSQPPPSPPPPTGLNFGARPKGGCDDAAA